MAESGQGGQRIAVVGATGAVGHQIVELIYERGLRFSKLTLYGSPETEQISVEAAGEDRDIEPLTKIEQLAEFDLAFLAVPPAVAQSIIEARLSPCLIDLSGAQVQKASSTLVAPGFTPRSAVIELARTSKVISTPHPAALALATILRALKDDDLGLVSAVVMLGASTRGKRHAEEAIRQAAAALNGELELPEGTTQVAFNVLVGDEELELARLIPEQVACLLGYQPGLVVQVVKVPALHGTALSVCLPPTEHPGLWQERLRSAPGILFEENKAPTLLDVINYEAIVLSVMQERPGYLLWGAFDNLRVAALSALWVAETISFADHVID